MQYLRTKSFLNKTAKAFYFSFLTCPLVSCVFGVVVVASSFVLFFHHEKLLPYGRSSAHQRPTFPCSPVWVYGERTNAPCVRSRTTCHCLFTFLGRLCNQLYMMPAVPYPADGMLSPTVSVYLQSYIVPTYVCILWIRTTDFMHENFNVERVGVSVYIVVGRVGMRGLILAHRESGASAIRVNIV